MLIAVIVLVLLGIGASVERWLLRRRPERLLGLGAPAGERRVELGEAQADRARDASPKGYRENDTTWSAERLQAPPPMAARGARYAPPSEGRPGWIEILRRGQRIGVGRVGLSIEAGASPRLAVRLALFPLAAIWVAGVVALMVVVFFWFAAPLVALAHTALTVLFFGLPVWSHHADLRRQASPLLDAVAKRYAQPEVAATSEKKPGRGRARSKKTKKRAKR